MTRGGQLRPAHLRIEAWPLEPPGPGQVAAGVALILLFALGHCLPIALAELQVAGQEVSARVCELDV